MAEPYCFGQFTLDPAQSRLSAHGVRVPLGSTEFRVLLTLVERQGDLVTKDELVSRVWGRSAIGDNALHVHIHALRKVVGEESIITKRGRGYRFAAPVRLGSQPVQRASEQQPGNLSFIWTSNTPGGPARLIGRCDEVRCISELLARARLVTLTGHGGIGKTRLALQAASKASARHRDGVWLMELAALHDAELVASAIASTLGVEIGANAKPLETLSRHLAHKSMLIVLDNCEHLLVACARTAEALLAAAPGLVILATSREALSCSAEQVFEVPPLAVPLDGTMAAEALRNVAAVDLFIERAAGADAGFSAKDDDLPVIAGICRRLDGLPLVIEMAAAWAGVLGLEVLDRKLDRSLNTVLHTGNVARPRHSTLHATLQWSYGLLSTAEQGVLCRLAVFADSFTMAAAEAVAGCDTVSEEQIFGHIGSLVGKSMIAVAPAAVQQKRYRLLQTTRSFMLEKLTLSGESDPVRRRHAQYVLAVLEEASSELETTSDATWVERYGPMIDDLRTALDWAMTADSDLAVALAGASSPLWRELALRTEGKQRLGAATALLHSAIPAASEARLRCGLAELSLHTPDTRAAHEEIARATALYRMIEDAPRLGRALTALAFALLTLDRTEEAEQAILEAIRLLEPAGWLRTLGRAYSVQSCIQTRRGDFETVFAAGEKAKFLCDVVGADRSALVIAANLVQLRLEYGDVDGAISAGRAAAARLRNTRHCNLLGFILGILAGALTARGDLDEALSTAREAVPLLRDGDALFWLFDHLALRSALAGRARDAALIAGYATAVHEKSGRPREPMGRNAAERLNLLLHEALPEDQVAELDRLGARLTEDQTIAIALSAGEMAHRTG